MKLYKLFIRLSAFAGMIGLYSCNNDEANILPDIDMQSINFRYETRPGEITLKWDTPKENPGFLYMKLEYHDHRLKKDITVPFSQYTNEYTIKNTRARYTEGYTFKLTPYSSTDTPGKSIKLEGCISKPAEIVENISKVKLQLTIDNFWASSFHPSRELKYICDGDLSTLYHTAWDDNLPNTKKYIDIDLGVELDRFNIHTWNSPNHDANGGIPTTVKLFAISSLGDESVDIETATPFYTYNHPNKDRGGEGEITIPSLEEDVLSTPVRFIRYYTKGSNSDHWNMGEMEISSIKYTIINPENEEEDIIEN